MLKAEFKFITAIIGTPPYWLLSKMDNKMYNTISTNSTLCLLE